MSGGAGVPWVGGVVLAAGASSRLGAGPPKQLLDAGGQPLVRRAAATALAAGVAELVVVVGHRAGEVAAALAGLELAVVRCRDWSAGLSASLRAGLAALSPGADAALILPCDQPFLSPALLARLLAVHAATQAPIVAPVAGGVRRGAPALFARSLFAELRSLSGDDGGRVLLARYPHRVGEVAVDDPRQLADLDTPADRLRLLG